MRRRLVIRLIIAAGVLLSAAVAGLAVLIATTSAPELPPPRSVANPNAQVVIAVRSDQGSDAQQTGLVYQDITHPDRADPACSGHGRWSLDVNPQDVVGYPYTPPPTARDWAIAFQAIAAAHRICPAPVVVNWYAHNRAHPASDRWMVVFPSTLVVDGAALARYALRHAQQL